MTRNLKLKASTKNAARSSGDSKSSSSPRVKTVARVLTNLVIVL